MNHLQGLGIKVVGWWPTLPKNFNQKENTMKYMTNQMLQRFMAHMSDNIAELHEQSLAQRCYAVFEAKIFGKSLDSTRRYRDYLSACLNDMSYIQTCAKGVYRYRSNLLHGELQRMEKVVTKWILKQQSDCNWNWMDYLENRHDSEQVKYFRNQVKQGKQKFAKLVELQQAIRKQKSITKD